MSASAAADADPRSVSLDDGAVAAVHLHARADDRLSQVDRSDVRMLHLGYGAGELGSQ